MVSLILLVDMQVNMSQLNTRTNLLQGCHNINCVTMLVEELIKWWHIKVFKQPTMGLWIHIL